MNLDFDRRYFTTDTVAVEATALDGSGDPVDTVDDFDWNEQTTVTIDNEPWVDAFDTDEFHRIEYTVAQPLEQPYIVDGDVTVQAKPRDELVRTRWQTDNLGGTLGHPPQRRIVSDEQIRTFWKHPVYDFTEDELRLTQYVPVTDEEAKEFVAENPNVSVGHTNGYALPEEYDGEVGGDVDLDTVDALQVDLSWDHIANVKQGRCSRSGGNCGPVNDDAHGHLVPLGDIRDQTGDDVCSEGPCSCGRHDTVDAPDGIHVDGGDWYGIAPSETVDDEPKYDLNTCDDVQDAYNLRNNGDYSIETSTLATRIKRAAEAHDCPPEFRPWVDTNDADDTHMTDDYDFPDLDTDVVIDEHDGVAERINSLNETVDELESEKDEAEDRLEALQQTVDELREQTEQYERQQFEERKDTLTDLTDHWDEESLDEQWEEGDLTLDTLDERIEFAEEVLSDDGEATDTTVTNDSDDPEETEDADIGGFRPDTA